MAVFADLKAADARAQELMASGAAISAYSCCLSDGTVAVRLLRPMSAEGVTADGMSAAGAWDVVTSDSDT